MPLTKIELRELIEGALKDELTDKQHKKLCSELCKKLSNNELDSIKERIILSSYALYDSQPNRAKYLERAMENWRKSQVN